MRTWLEIDLNLYKKNLEYIRSLLQPKEEIMLILKANCYGIGDKELLKIAYKQGIKNFAVATIDEGVKIRKYGFNECNILVLGHTSLEQINIAIKNNLIITITGKEHAKILLKTPNKNLKIAIAVDTGMCRLGFTLENIKKDREILQKLAVNFQVKSVFTHLSQADSFSEECRIFTAKQISKFYAVKSQLNICEKWHYKNSAGILKQLKPASDFARVGIIQYGILPSQEFTNENLKPIFTWKSRIGCVKEIKKGDCVGYGINYRAKTKMKIAVVNVGYGDGYNRLLSNKGRVIVHDTYCNIIGNVCMDQLMIDVSNVKRVNVGDQVVLIGKTMHCTISVEEIAKQCSTIAYEIMCNINSKRVKRIYLNK